MNAVSLVDIVGFSTGIVLYGLLAWMAVPSRHDLRANGERLSFATGLLGLLWNLGALVIFGLDDAALPRAPLWIAPLAYAALGFLPAVAVHAAASERRRTADRWLPRLAYGLAAIAAAGQFAALARGGEVPARWAMLLLTIGNCALIGALVFLAGPVRRLSAAALAVFAVMALHLTGHVRQADSWPVALLGHHGSVALALAILWQDYRFALADVFLKRALTFITVVLVAVAAWMMLMSSGAWRNSRGGPPSAEAVLLVLGLWVATALVTPAIVRGVAWLVDRVMLRRDEVARAGALLAARVSEPGEPEAMLDEACRALSVALGARDVRWREIPHVAASDAQTVPRGSVSVRVATTDAPAYAIDLGGLAGGRRILSGDLAVLESVASLLARRIDAVRVSRERHERDLREETLHGLSSEAELRALRAQLNPHFLFNALTTLGYLMRAAPDRAQAALYSLTSLLRAVLSRSSAESCTLDEELALIGDYLAIERARFEERLRVELDVPEDLRAARVPPLLLQPLVENAVKHGITPSRHGGKVIVRARRMPGELLRIQVRDTGIGVENGESLDERRRSHVGLSNLEQRLDRTYGTEASLTFSSVPGAGATVTVTLPLRFALEPHRAAS